MKEAIKENTIQTEVQNELRTTERLQKNVETRSQRGYVGSDHERGQSSDGHRLDADRISGESGQIRENLVGMDATESSGTADILSEERLLSGTASRDQSESGGRIPGTVHQIHDRAENRNVLGAERESQPESRGTGIAADRIPDSTGTGHHQSLQDTGGLSETAGTAALLNEEIKEANSADAIADEKIDSIASWLDVAAMGESTSKIDVFKSICADENIHLNETFMKKMYEKLS